MPAFIDVGDGTLITPPPRAPDVQQAAPPPQIAPTTESPQTQTASPPPAVAPGHSVIDVGNGDYITPPIVSTATPMPDASAVPGTIGESETHPEVQPGHALIDVGDGTYIAPPSAAGIYDVTAPGTSPVSEETNSLLDPSNLYALDHSEQGLFDVLGFFPDLDGFDTLAIGTLRGKAFVDYVRSGSSKRGLNPIVVFADTYHEGLSGGIGDGGTSYGFAQLHDSGALPRQYWNLGKYVAKIQTWAWTTAGIDYVLDIMQRVVAGTDNAEDQMHRIVFDFERPDKTQQQYVSRLDTYYAFKAQGEKLWPMLNDYVKGPGYAGAQTSAPATAPKQQPRTIATWRGLLEVMRDDLPAAGIHMQNTARRLGKAIT